MKVPSVVRIGGVDYAVHVVEFLRSGDDFLYGDIRYGDCTIRISETDNVDHQHKCITLWHEILHGIAEHAGLALPAEEEERIVNVLSKGVYQVLQDNAAAFFDLRKE